EAGRHGVAAELLEVRADSGERAVQIEAGDAAARATAEFASLVPADQKGRPPVALDEAGGDDADYARVPRRVPEHDGGVGRVQRLIHQLDRFVENQLIHLLAARIDRLELARQRRRFLGIL